MRDDRFAEIDRAVNDRFLLLALQDARDDRLGSDSIAAVVNDNSAESVRSHLVDRVVHFDALRFNETVS